MSLYDKQNKMQFSHGQGDWQSISGGYAQPSDDDTKDTLDDFMEQNTAKVEATAENLEQESESPEKVAVSITPKKELTETTIPKAIPIQEEVIENDTVEEEIHLVAKTEQKSSLASDVEVIPETIDPTKHTILVVDDHEDTLSMYATLFYNEGYNVLQAKDGLEGLDKATKNQPDIIFTGIIMPRMDGFTMIEALHKNAVLTKTPIVINSHLGRQQDKERAHELGAKDFIVRDYTAPREVIDRISALLVTMEYEIPFDVHAEYAKDLLADIGGKEALSCESPVLKLRLSDAHEKTFTGKLVCE